MSICAFPTKFAVAFGASKAKKLAVCYSGLTPTIPPLFLSGHKIQTLFRTRSNETSLREQQRKDDHARFDVQGRFPSSATLQHVYQLGAIRIGEPCYQSNQEATCEHAQGATPDDGTFRPEDGNSKTSATAKAPSASSAALPPIQSHGRPNGYGNSGLYLPHPTGPTSSRPKPLLFRSLSQQSPMQYSHSHLPIARSIGFEDASAGLPEWVKPRPYQLPRLDMLPRSFSRKRAYGSAIEPGYTSIGSHFTRESPPQSQQQAATHHHDYPARTSPSTDDFPSGSSTSSGEDRTLSLTSVISQYGSSPRSSPGRHMPSPPPLPTPLSAPAGSTQELSFRSASGVRGGPTTSSTIAIQRRAHEENFGFTPLAQSGRLGFEDAARRGWQKELPHSERSPSGFATSAQHLPRNFGEAVSPGRSEWAGSPVSAPTSALMAPAQRRSTTGTREIGTRFPWLFGQTPGENTETPLEGPRHKKPRIEQSPIQLGGSRMQLTTADRPRPERSTRGQAPGRDPQEVTSRRPSNASARAKPSKTQASEPASASTLQQRNRSWDARRLDAPPAAAAGNSVKKHEAPTGGTAPGRRRSVRA